MANYKEKKRNADQWGRGSWLITTPPEARHFFVLALHTHSLTVTHTPRPLIYFYARHNLFCLRYFVCIHLHLPPNSAPEKFRIIHTPHR